MNKDQMKNNVGKRVLLQPPARRLQLDGLVQAAPPDDWWLVEEVTPAGVKISDPGSGHFRVLRYDHIHKFTSDQPLDGFERGFLTLHVQLVVQGDGVDVVPNARPGESVAELRARVFFAPELQRIFRRQVEILDRVIPNYSQTSHAKGPCGGDSWASLKPFRPDHYPTSLAGVRYPPFAIAALDIDCHHSADELSRQVRCCGRIGTGVEPHGSSPKRA
jgi:hypothetical protein